MWNPEEVALNPYDRVSKVPAELLAETFDWQSWSDALAQVTEQDKQWLDDLRKIEGLGYLQKALSEQEHEDLRTFYQEMREKMKDMNIRMVLPQDLYPSIDRKLSDMVIGIGHCEIDTDLASIEERAAAFMAQAQLWDDRVLGAEEEYVEVCSDPELAQITHQIAQERLEEAKRVIVLGSGPRVVGSLTGAILASLQSKHGGTYFDVETYAVDTVNTKKDQPFLDYHQSKLRKGKGHHKFKKGKKK